MQKIFRCRKFIGLITLISALLICFPLSPAQAVMITTEYVIHQESKKLSDRGRVSAFLRRADVIAQMQAFGISLEEAQSRTDSLTDNEIAERVSSAFDFRLAEIIRRFRLRDLPQVAKDGFYPKLAAFGHVGRTDVELPWEVVDHVEV